MPFYRGMTCANVTIGGDGGDPITAYVARPEGAGPFPGVVLIHHLPGWSELYIETTRRFAHHGYMAICANLYEREGGADPMRDPSFAVVAESSCTYVSEVAYPQVLVVGLAIERLGASSITYRTALWVDGAQESDPVAAFGRWVHVYVDREGRRATPMPAQMRAALERI